MAVARQQIAIRTGTAHKNAVVIGALRKIRIELVLRALLLGAARGH
jgi:hypothetical protein